MNRLQKRIRALRRALLCRRPADAATLLIVGCQRSGTSLFLRVVERDWRARGYGEKSELFHDRVGDRRMIALDAAVSRVASARARLVAVKPLVESHRVPEMLDAFPNAVAVWMFRDARSVAPSNLAAFGVDNGERDMAPILARDVGDWRAAGVDAATLDRVAELARHATEPVEWAALFWWVRNSIFFDRGYDTHPRVFTCAYDDLVAGPVAVMEGVYGAANLPFPGERITAEVNDRSLGKGRDLVLHPEISSACEDMLARLRDVDRERSVMRCTEPVV